MTSFESVVEQAAIEWFQNLGYASGIDIAPDGTSLERGSYTDVFLRGRFHQALARINPHLGPDTLELVARSVLSPETPSLAEQNQAVHRWLPHGVAVRTRKGGSGWGDHAWLLDFEHPERNDWLVVNQLTVVEGKHNRRPDLVVYVNGLPLALIELKNPEDPHATIRSAWNQLQTYQAHIPSLFQTNEILAISAGTEARVGSLTAGFERFGPWRTVDGEEPAPEGTPRLHRS
jgi:type I restriction enzyme R subunit